MSSNMADLPLDLVADQFPHSDWHLKVKMSLNLADLSLDLLADLTPGTGHLHGQGEFKFGRSTPLVLKSHSQDEFQIWQIYP